MYLIGVISLRRTAQQKGSLSLRSFLEQKGHFLEQSCPAGLAPASHPISYFHEAVGKNHFVEQSKYEIAGKARNDKKMSHLRGILQALARKRGVPLM